MTASSVPELAPLIQPLDRTAWRLHWFLAASILIMIPLGIALENTPKASALRPILINAHQGLGLTILVVGAIRLSRRLLQDGVAAGGQPALAKLSWATMARRVLLFATIAFPISGIWLSRETGLPLIGLTVWSAPVGREISVAVAEALHSHAVKIVLVPIIIFHIVKSLRRTPARRDQAPLARLDHEAPRANQN